MLAFADRRAAGHWNYTHADEVAPRRIGFGGITIRAPSLANQPFSAVQDMAAATLSAELGPLTLRLTLSEGAEPGSRLVLRLASRSKQPLELDVQSCKTHTITAADTAAAFQGSQR